MARISKIIHAFPVLWAGFAAGAAACLAGCGQDGSRPKPDPASSVPPPAFTSAITQSTDFAQAESLALAQGQQASIGDGGTITFQNIGAAGWYPSPRDPASGTCDAYHAGSCCMTRHDVPAAGLAPWNEDLILTLRGPMLVKQLAVYQAGAADNSDWTLASVWYQAQPSASHGMAFKSDEAAVPFQGMIGNKCLIDVSSDREFPCGPGSVPYCAASAQPKYYGWEGSKLILMLASMPHMDSPALAGMAHCSVDKSDNWYDAPWVGLSHGELIRAGKFGGCNCYSKDPIQWQAADGCGQFNVFEVVNDNNAYQNFEVFSTNFFAYHGYVGDGPCGKNCLVTGLDPKVDLVDKATSRESLAGATANPQKGPGAAFRRPAEGYRYFLILMDMQTRTVQLALVDPANMPVQAQDLLNQVPSRLPRATVTDLAAMRLPGNQPLSIRNP